ncbi:SET domain-containing protein [Phlegmacium glaucopus]|nr:SET domain-containing protein [Phlegmacium glaucopus]
MKRGFLNSAKAKREPLYPSSKDTSGGATSAAVAPVTNSATANYLAKLDHRKLEDTALPKNYIPEKLKIEESDWNKVDFEDKNTLLMTTIPQSYIDGPNDPDGHSEWMVKASTKLKVITAPGYPKSTPKPRMPNICTVKETPNMGFGLFATADIGPNELIFSERPLIVYPKSIMGVTLDELNQYSRLDWKKIALHEWERKLEYLVGRMNDDDQKAYRSLWNSHTEDGSGPLLGIARTNGYSISLHDGPVKTTTNTYAAVGKLASRINHSCLANVYQEFDVPSFSIQHKARYSIKAGEQIFYAYCRLDLTAAERRLELEPYGVVCTCSVCVNATPETDILHKECARRVEVIRDLLNRSASNVKMVDRLVEEGIEMQQAMLKEGLDNVDAYVDLIDLLVAVRARI